MILTKEESIQEEYYCKLCSKYVKENHQIEETAGWVELFFVKPSPHFHQRNILFFPNMEQNINTRIIIR